MDVITDVSTQNDFQEAGIAYLNLAWVSSIDLGLDLRDMISSESDEIDESGKVAEEYWHSAQRRLATSMSLLQQGVEFLIKARIASVSPFLLIDGSPRDWPSKCTKQDTPFSAFKTIDAQDLIRAHDTVYSQRFTAQFVNQFEQLRSRRNTIMHAVDRTLRFTTNEVLSLVLEFAETFIGPGQWASIRAKAIEEEPGCTSGPARMAR